MSMVRLKPAFKDYLWGGTKLKEQYNKKTDASIVAESWELSTHKDGQSVVDSGEHKGMLLQEYLQLIGKDALGKKGKCFDRFPILIKFIDALGNLSIQVHPNDRYALKNENDYGKTEMWYILEAEEGSFLYYGTNREITKEEFKERIEKNTLLDVLNKVPVHKGDVFFIAAGTIHAIGAGIVICEIQQNSNVTYRVYDYNRLGVDGKPRELHIKKAIDVSNLKPIPLYTKPIGEKVYGDGYTATMMATCSYFTTYIYEVEDSCEVCVDEESFASMIIVDGGGSIAQGSNVLDAKKGDSFFVSAGSGNVVVKGKCRFILSCV